MEKEQELEKVFRNRIKQTEQQMLKSLDCVQKGMPAAAEDQDDRMEAAIERNFRVAPQIAKIMSEQLRSPGPGPAAAESLTLGPEAIQGSTIDFVPVAYMERGLQVAKAVSRIITLDRRAIGTGFLCSEKLLITNNHVIPTPAHADSFLAEFNFEIALNGTEKETATFRLDPKRFFFTDGIDGLDVTVVAIGEQVSGNAPVSSFGWCGLSDSGTKHALGDFVTIIQHPAGRHKEVVLRENRIVGRHELALHYVADTEPGSSGSPAFNSNWQPVALHHWGGTHAWAGDSSYLPRTVNEGIRISRIVRALRDLQSGLNSHQSDLIGDLLQKGIQGFPELISGPVHVSRKGSADFAYGSRPNEEGGMTWTIPLEVSVNLPGASGKSRTYSTKDDVSNTTAVTHSLENTNATLIKPGYRPDFIDGFIVPLPEMKTRQRDQLARIKPEKVVPGQNDWELRYQHFSVAMNKDRRLAFYTAVNIHGESLVGYSRKTNEFYEYDVASTAFAESMTGAEADKWAIETRIDLEHQTFEQFYKSMPNKLVDANGHENLDETPNFDRGHLVKRLDPCWGSQADALIAERDTFHWTNAAPQTSAFNQGKAKSLLGQKEGRLWQGIENYILRNAWAMDTKVSLFTGPVFKADDPVYSDKTGEMEIQVPLVFWKVLVWSEAGKLKSLALKADQTKTMQKRDGNESLVEDDQLALMEHFLTTVAKVEELTGFEFGEAVSNADLRKGRRDAEPEKFDDEFG